MTFWKQPVRLGGTKPFSRAINLVRKYNQCTLIAKAIENKLASVVACMNCVESTTMLTTTVEPTVEPRVKGQLTFTTIILRHIYTSQ